MVLGRARLPGRSAWGLLLLPQRLSRVRTQTREVRRDPVGLVVGGREGGFYKGNTPPLIMRARNGVHLLFVPDSWSLRGRALP